MKMKANKKWKYIAYAAMVVTVVSTCLFVFNSKDSEYDEVAAYINSGASNNSKVVYLEKRYSNEMGRLDILLNHSDLCSPKYLNELSTLTISYEATLNGYDILTKTIDFSKYKNLSRKLEDYKLIIENYNIMYDEIDNENYEEALKRLDEIDKLRSQLYGDIDKEISQVK